MDSCVMFYFIVSNGKEGGCPRWLLLHHVPFSIFLFPKHRAGESGDYLWVFSVGVEDLSRGRPEGLDTVYWFWKRTNSWLCFIFCVYGWPLLFCFQIFTEDLTEVETLPRHRVLHFLKEGFKELAIPYLEHIIYVWEDKGPEFHNVLIQLYLERVQSLMKQYLNSLPEGLTRAPVDKILKKKTPNTYIVSFLHRNRNNSSDVLFHWRKRLWCPWRQDNLFPWLNNKHKPNNCTLNLWTDFHVITFMHMDPVRAVSCSQLSLAAPQTKPMPELIMKSIPLRLFAPLNPRWTSQTTHATR